MDYDITTLAGTLVAHSSSHEAELRARQHEFRAVNWRTHIARASVRTEAISAQVRPEVARFGRMLARLAAPSG